jgi:hypothetical protein
VIGEIFLDNMFGFLEDGKDHGTYIASLDASIPTLCISAIGPAYLRPIIMASSILYPAGWNALRAMDAIRTAAIAATGKRVQDLDQGVAHQNDMLLQLLDKVREKGDKVKFSRFEVTLEAYTAMYVAPTLQASNC